LIGGGCNNRVCSNCSVIAGGNNNCINTTCHKNFIGGGEANDILGTKGCHTIGGGSVNIINTVGNKDTIAGGGGNCITCNVENSTIAGGAGNKICKTSGFDYGSTIGGGAINCLVTSTYYSTIAGGVYNCSTAGNTFIGGGRSNVVSSTAGGILGGCSNTVSHTCSFIVGSNLTSTAACYTFMNNACVFGTTRTTTLVETSARKHKECIVPLQNQIENLKKLEPVSFTWKEDKKEDIGLIAEDVEKVLPKMVSYEDNGELHGVQYSKLTAILIKAFQEQQNQIEELKEEVKLLKQNK
jgi:hypothetical protein